ncbi:TlpA family protein disulfide reductase [Parapedobacter sp. GCM10030251]|uniref:TlpA family protein disulfide reductase n=1 Tax=Parapedobacter sp. GCM10030251 TaxID=3273419 RepID=UPI003623650A
MNVTNAQRTFEATDVLKKTCETLNNLKRISYSSHREISNIRSNDFVKNSGDSYFEYHPNKEGNVSRFQLYSTDAFQVYNGTEYFLLNHKDCTIDLQKATINKLGNLTLLHNSITTLRVALPLLIANDSIPKSIQDTLIDNKSYYLIKFELYKKTLDFPKGVWGLKSDVTRFYTLIVDKMTYLPYIVFDSNSIENDRYYTKTVFTNINTDPMEPTENSWFFSSYNGYKPLKDEAQKPMISVGHALPNWKLPEIKKQTTDTLTSSDFKGKMILVEFWIKNCGYCLAAFPELKALQEKYGKQIEILSINAYEAKDDVTFFYNRESPAYRMLYDGQALADKIGIYGYPTIILVDRAGKVAYVSLGFNTEKIEAAIKKAL